MSHYTTKIDIWGILYFIIATACIIYELFTNKILFEGKTEGD